jgi:hypothetical protein
VTQPKTSKAKRTRYVVAYNRRLRRWAATVKGQSRIEYATQAEAITATAAIARANQPAEIIIKARDGVIRDNRTYGADPRRSKG